MFIFRLPVMLVLFILLLMYVIHLIGIEVRLSFPAQVEMSLTLFMLGILIVALGAYTFRKANTTVNPLNPENASSLVTSGIYRYSRNPQYIGFLLWLLAGAVYSANLLNLVLLPVFILLANRLYIYREERALEKLFGQDFYEYRRKVRRWI